MPELVSGRIRSLFRNEAAGSTYNEIVRMWQSEGFPPSNCGIEEQGVRRTVWREYEESVDWSNREHVGRAIRVFESLLLGMDEEWVEKCRSALALDNWQIDGQRRIQRSSSHLSALSGLDQLREPGGIIDAFHRVDLLLDANPAGVVGAAKELIESTAKSILEALGEVVDPKADVPELIARTQKALGLHPSSVHPTVDSSDATKKILGGVSAAAIGINELRNVDGGGHGRARAPRLSPRHGRLAVNAARTWCELMLDTHGDPDAPWRRVDVRLE